jgi:hypothetical protein
MLLEKKLMRILIVCVLESKLLLDDNLSMDALQLLSNLVIESKTATLSLGSIITMMTESPWSSSEFRNLLGELLDLGYIRCIERLKPKSQNRNWVVRTS